MIGSLADYGVKWFTDVIGRITVWFIEMLTDGYDAITRGLLSTPTPSGSGTELVFSKPSSGDEPWYSIYEATVGGEMMVFGLLVLFVCVQGRHFVRIFDIGSAHEHRRTRRSALTGGFLIISWYWIAVLMLYFVEALTIGLLPDVGAVTTALLTILPDSLSSSLLTLCMAALGAMAVVFLRVLFIIRELLLYVLLYVMPIGIAVVYGNLPIVSEIARRFCVQFVALAVLPLPGALLLRGYSLLFAGSTTIPIGGSFFAYVVVISLPIIAAYVTWKTFSYAAPLASRAFSSAGRGALLAGTVGTAAYVAGPRAAAVASRWGTRGAAGAMIARRYGGGDHEQSQAHSSHERRRRGGRPPYRRTENDR
jgi:hypothetical protein